jgi:hypothetical protein
VALVAALVAAVGGGCMFSTRTPESPTTDVWTPKTPINASTVLDNVKGAFEARDAGAYALSLDDPFYFEPDPAEVGAIGTFDDWTRNLEQNAFTSVFDKCSRISFIWNPVPTEDNNLTDPYHPGPSGTWLYYKDLKYSIAFTVNGKAVTSSGISDLYVREDSLTQHWILWRWDERNDGSGHESLGQVRFKKEP